MQTQMRFDGRTYSPDRDGSRLASQLAAVKALMLDGQWHTLAEIAARSRCSEASASARVRDLRKPRFGSFVIERRRVPDGNGLHEYRLLNRQTDIMEFIRQEGA